jgi:hypothetical protein
MGKSLTMPTHRYYRSCHLKKKRPKVVAAYYTNRYQGAVSNGDNFKSKRNTELETDV